MAIPATWVDAPARAPRPNRSLDVIPVHDKADRLTGIEFMADPCVMPGSLPQDCIVTIGPEAGTEKEFGEPGVVYESEVFGAYVGIQCYLNGGIEEFRATSRRVLEAGEHAAVDAAIAASLEAIATPLASATTVAQAIGLLEVALAQSVPTRGFIYLSPMLVTLAASESLLVRNIDGTLETYLGTPIVVLTTLTGLVAYASGPTNLWRSRITDLRAPDVTHNIGVALSERLYTLTVECGAWKVTVPAPVGTPPPSEGPGTPLSLVIGSIPSSPIPDGTDTTIYAHANVAPAGEVYLWYAVNGGTPVEAGEMTQVSALEFVWNVQGEATTSGDSVEVWVVSGTTESNHIIIQVT